MAEDFDLRIKISTSSDAAVKSLTKVSNSIEKLGESVKRVGENLDRIEKSFKKFGREFTQNITLPLAAIAGLSLKKVFDDVVKGVGGVSSQAVTFVASVQELKRQIDALSISLGNILAPTASRIVFVFVEVIKWVKSLNSETKQLVVNVGLISAAIGPVVLAFTAFLGVTSKIVIVLGSILGAINPIVVASVVAAAAIGGMVNLFINLQKAGSSSIAALGQSLSLIPTLFNKYMVAPLIKMAANMGRGIAMILDSNIILKPFAALATKVAEQMEALSSRMYVGFNEIKINLDTQLESIGSSVADSFSFGFESSMSELEKKFKEAFAKFSSNLPSVETELNDPMLEAFRKAEEDYAAFLESIKNKAKEINMEISSNMTNAFLDIADGAKTAEQAFADFARTTLRNITQMIIQMQIFKAISGAGGSGGAGGAFAPGAVLPVATGGYITGPGTGTSDSIAARLSNGEFVANAKTVKTFGVDFFHNLQRMAKSGVVTKSKGSIPGFAEGGFVSQGGGAPQVVVQNNGTPKSVASESYDPLNAVTTVVLEDLQRNGPISKGMQNTFKMRRGSFR